MHLSQSAIFQLCVASLCAGGLLSLLFDVLGVIQIWLTSPYQRYTVPKIQALYYTRLKSKKAKKRRGLRVVIFFEDMLFCIVGAITLVLLLYWLNNGAFRAVAPLSMAIGFALCHVSVSKWVGAMLQWIAFGTETLVYWFCLPFKRLFAIIVAKLHQNAQKRRKKRLARRRRNFTNKEIQNIAKVANKLLPLI